MLMALTQMPCSWGSFSDRFSPCLSRLEARDSPEGHAGGPSEGHGGRAVTHQIAVSSPDTWGARTAGHGAGGMVSSLKRVFWPKASGTQSWLISHKSQREEGNSEKIFDKEEKELLLKAFLAEPHYILQALAS